MTKIIHTTRINDIAFFLVSLFLHLISNIPYSPYTKSTYKPKATLITCTTHKSLINEADTQPLITTVKSYILCGTAYTLLISSVLTLPLQEVDCCDADDDHLEHDIIIKVLQFYIITIITINAGHWLIEHTQIEVVQSCLATGRNLIDV